MTIELKKTENTKTSLHVLAQVTPFPDGNYINVHFRKENDVTAEMDTVVSNSTGATYVFTTAADFSSKVLEGYTPSTGELVMTDGIIKQLRAAGTDTTEEFLRALNQTADAIGATYSVVKVPGFPIPNAMKQKLDVAVSVTKFPDSTIIDVTYRREGDTSPIVQHIATGSDKQVYTDAANFSNKVLEGYTPSTGKLVVTDGIIEQLRVADTDAINEFLHVLKQTSAQMGYAINIAHMPSFPAGPVFPPRMS